MSRIFIHIIFSCISLIGLCNQPIGEVCVEIDDDIVSLDIYESQSFSSVELYDLDEDDDGKLKPLALKILELYCCNDSPHTVKVYINPFFLHHILFEADSSPPGLTVLV